MFNTGFLIMDLFFKGFEEPMQLKDQIRSHCGYQCWPEWLKNNVFFPARENLQTKPELFFA